MIFLVTAGKGVLCYLVIITTDNLVTQSARLRRPGLAVKCSSGTVALHLMKSWVFTSLFH